MADEEPWFIDWVPIDLGDGIHRAGRDEKGDVFWLHTCTNGRRALGTCDVTSGTRHQLVSDDPLHLEPSILCVECKDHGFIRNGAWEAA